MYLFYTFEIKSIYIILYIHGFIMNVCHMSSDTIILLLVTFISDYS